MASVAEGVNTPFSTVFTVLRVTPTFSASSAWVRPSSDRRSFRRLASRSAIAKRAALEHAEIEERRRHRHGDNDVDGVPSADGLDHIDDVESQRRTHGRPEAVDTGGLAVGPGALVIDELAHGPRPEPGPAGREAGEQDDGEDKPGADLQMVDRARRMLRDTEIACLLREEDHREGGKDARAAPVQFFGLLGNGTLVHFEPFL